MPLTMPRELATAVAANLGATRVVHPDTGAEYVLLTAGEYAAVQEWIEDDREQRALAEFAVQSAAARILADEAADQ